MNSADSAAVPEPDFNALRRLERMYRFSRIRFALLLLIPALWLLGGALISLGPMSPLAAGILIGWFFITLFGVSAWVFLLIPEKEEIKRKYVSHVLPHLFHKASVNVSYYPAHDLSVNSILKSGLFHDRYNAILREDCINGNAGRMKFGMYQVAMQISSHTPAAGRLGSRSGMMTNQFYGWVIHAVIPPVSGTHVILPRLRKTSGESDDWIEKVNENWWHNPHCPAQATGYPPFDAHFLVYTNDPQRFFSFATKEFFDFLLYLFSTGENTFAISISGTLFSMHMGHKTPTFRHCPDGDFTKEYHPELLQEVKWFADLLKGIQRFTTR